MKFEDIKELVELISEKNIAKVKIKNNKFELLIEKNSSNNLIEQQALSPSENQLLTQNNSLENQTNLDIQISDKEEKSSGINITSPMVGTFYVAPSPDSPPFVKEGDKVRKGDTLCILEAMKIMNELEAEFECRILEILVKDGEPVEYDKPLFRVEKL